jgi:primary-amine oxidase
LIPGYDCPYGATYLNTTFGMGTTIFHQPGNVRIFEADIGVPITRHVESEYLQATKGSKLVVRMIGTIGNYATRGTTASMWTAPCQ